MSTYIILGILLFLITFINRNSEVRSRKAFLFSFVILFIFAAIRYEYGPDYFSYQDSFSELKSKGLALFLNTDVHMEKLFVLFFNMFNHYFTFIIVHSLIWIGVFYLFFKKYICPSNYFWVLLLMFANINLLLLQLVAFRSALAGCCLLIGLGFLVSDNIFEEFPILGRINFFSNKSYLNYALYIFLVIIGSQFHTSIIVFIIVPFFTLRKAISVEFSNFLLGLFIVLAFISLTFRGSFSSNITLWIINTFSNSFDRYSEYSMIKELGGHYGIGALAINLMRVAVAYPILRALIVESDVRYLWLMHIAIAFLLAFFVIDEIVLSRYTMCFYPIIIVALLRSLEKVSSTQKAIPLFSILFISLFQLITCLRSVSYESFFHYQTIFSAPCWQ